MSAQSFFNKIDQVSAKELLEFLEHNQTELLLKLEDKYVKTNITAIKDDKFFTLLKFSSYNFSNFAVTCSFQVKEERYFFNSFLNSTNIGTTLDLPTGVFHLQRRNDYRVSMPVGVHYVCEIRLINGNKSNIKVEIRDISLGGCQLSVKNIGELKSGDNVELYLKYDRFEFPSLKVTARHLKKVETQDQNYTLVGASLAEPNNQIVAELQSMLMFLDRLHRRKADD